MKEMTREEEEVGSTLRELLSDAVTKTDTDALLLSGGLDTSIIAILTTNAGRNKKAVTVSIAGTPAADPEYAKTIALRFHYEHHPISLTEDEALAMLPEVIKAVGTFDPAIPNDLVIYVALKEAKKLGIDSVMTGDGADELFAGYYFMHELSHDDLNKYIRTIARTMHFSSNTLGPHLGVQIKQPYLDKGLVDFALDVNPDLKIKTVRGRIYGKWILRKAFEKELDAVAWRAKEPIEFGSGATMLRAVIRRKISDTEFATKKIEYGLEFMNKEHLFFYEIYKEVVGEVPKARGEKVCPLCKADLPGFHCNICGFSSPVEKYI